MIDIQQVNKSFRGNIAVKELNLKVKKGEILGLLGANGAGKSSTINMLLGFLHPDSGTIYIKELDTSKETHEVRKLVGYIPENVNLYPYLTGLENLSYFCRLAKLSYSKDELTDILLICGLQSEAHHQKVLGYSKGMRQKVGIAIAYAKKAEVYRDEIQTSIDRQIQILVPAIYNDEKVDKNKFLDYINQIQK